MAFALVLSSVPAIVEDTFHAFSTMPIAVRTSIAPLPDAQLATVEGQHRLGKQEVFLYFLNIGKLEGLRRFLNLLYGIPALASMGNQKNLDPRLMINIQNIFQMQLDTGGAIQTNTAEVRQR